MAKKKGGSWHLNYQIKSGVGTPDDKFEANVNRTKKGLHVIANAGIPELDDDQLDKLEEAMNKFSSEMDDADASSPENHQKCLRMIADYCNFVADMIGG